MYHIVVDKQQIKTFFNFNDALQYYFVILFVFNYCYPWDISLTLDFIQQFFAEIKGEVLRGKKIGNTNILKIEELLNKIEDVKE